MKIIIATRIFEPEPSAASFRLAALARAFADRGHDVAVLTVKLPKSYFGDISSVDRSRGYRVTRFPVLRDREGYVRGYLQYLSFDIPLFFRLLFGHKADLVVVEPPPTTGFFARFATRLRRTPYVYYAADIWSDAAGQTGAPAFVVNAVRAVERWVWRGARGVFSVSPGVSERITQLQPKSKVIEVGNGVDVERMQTALTREPERGTDLTPAFVYAGTASEWQGASELVEAYARSSAKEKFPLRFIGGGSEREALRALAERLGVADRVSFEATVPVEEISHILANSVAAVVTLKPGVGYDFAFPTKVLAALACGAPVVFAGPGPVRDFLKQEVSGRKLGVSCDWDAQELSQLIDEAAREFEELNGEHRTEVRSWAAQHVSIDAVMSKAVRAVEARLQSATQAL